MKKLWTEEKYKRFHRRRQRRALAATKRQRRSDSRQRHEFGLQRLHKKDRRPRAEIVAPASFSLIKNADDTLEFLEQVKAKARKWHLFIRLNNVARIDPEAVAAFVAVMESMDNTRVAGDQPSDALCRQRLHDFGFFDRVNHGGSRISSSKGKIRIEHRGKDVEGSVAGEIMEFGMEKLGRDRKHGPTYSIFLEAMANTFQHAAGNNTTPKTWWATVYYDEQRKKACFTAVDIGVGIFESPTLKQRAAYLFKGSSNWPWPTEGEKLRALLEGKIPSRTGEKHRGRGLPSMYEAWRAKRISNLVIISNRAFADAEAGDYRNLHVGFKGTIIYWEVDSSEE